MESTTAVARVVREQGRTMTWLARRLGVSRVTLYEWARHPERCPTSRQQSIANELGVKRRELFP